MFTALVVITELIKFKAVLYNARHIHAKKFSRGECLNNFAKMRQIQTWQQNGSRLVRNSRASITKVLNWSRVRQLSASFPVKMKEKKKKKRNEKKTEKERRTRKSSSSCARTNLRNLEILPKTEKRILICP